LFFQLLALADVLRHDKPHTATGIFQFVRDQFHLENPAVFGLVTPLATVECTQRRMAPNVINGSPIARRLNIEHRHALEFFFAEAVLLYGRFIYLKKSSRFCIEDPRWQRGCAKKAAGTWTRSCAAHLRYVGDQSRVHVPTTDSRNSRSRWSYAFSFW